MVNNRTIMHLRLARLTPTKIVHPFTATISSSFSGSGAAAQKLGSSGLQSLMVLNAPSRIGEYRISVRPLHLDLTHQGMSCVHLPCGRDTCNGNRSTNRSRCQYQTASTSVSLRSKIGVAARYTWMQLSISLESFDDQAYLTLRWTRTTR